MTIDAYLEAIKERFVTDPVWSKNANALRSQRLHTSLGQVKPTRSSITVNVKQKLKQPIGDGLGVLSISKNALVIREGEYRKTLRRIVLTDRGCERIRAFIIAVCSEQHNLFALADVPYFTIRGIGS
jgi:hypothetical protein